MKIKEFVFNPVQVNCYVLYDETKECIIIDPACYFGGEMKALDEFITKNSLLPKLSIATHFHFDHLMGAFDICSKYDIPLAGHKNYRFLWEIGYEPAMTFGIEMKKPPEPSVILDNGTTVKAGNIELKAIHCPGHSPCGIALYHNDSASLFCGDILFHMSIGRTDLPGGDHEQLLTSIKNGLFTLPDDVVVYSGHGESTTIGQEKKANPFF